MRLLHTMFRVSNLEISVRFYTEVLKMDLLAQKDFPEGRFSLAFLGYANEGEQVALELTHNWDTDSYEHGSAFGHIAMKVDDVYRACEQMRNLGADIVRDAGPMSGGGPALAFVRDPDGYMIELLDTDPLALKW